MSGLARRAAGRRRARARRRPAGRSRRRPRARPPHRWRAGSPARPIAWPDALPSLIHRPRPLQPSSAAKNSRPATSVSRVGERSPPPGPQVAHQPRARGGAVAAPELAPGGGGGGGEEHRPADVDQLAWIRVRAQLEQFGAREGAVAHPEITAEQEALGEVEESRPRHRERLRLDDHAQDRPRRRGGAVAAPDRGIVGRAGDEQQMVAGADR